MFKIPNDEKLYQWDINRVLIVEDETIKEVHFANCLCNEARVCEVKPGFDWRYVNIPNELLQEYMDIKAWAYDGNITKHCATFPVEKRAKPADYVYTPTEVKSYEALEERVEELEKNRVTGAVRYDAIQSLTSAQKAQARKNIGAADSNRYAYNFQTLYSELTYAPNDAAAMNYIVNNWNKVPMSIYIQGYPVIGIDLNDKYLRVLKDDRYLYSFRWKVDGVHFGLAAHAMLKLANENEIVNVEGTGANEKKTLKPELLPNHSHSWGDVENKPDYIVEQGRSDNGWEYRKWNSGRAECWKYVTATVKTTDWKDSGMMSFMSYGLYWTRDIVIELPYPFTFTEHPVETAIMANGTEWLPLTLISTTHLQKDKTDSYRLCTYKQPDKDINVKIAFNVVGKWK